MYFHAFYCIYSLFIMTQKSLNIYHFGTWIIQHIQWTIDTEAPIYIISLSVLSIGQHIKQAGQALIASGLFPYFLTTCSRDFTFQPISRKDCIHAVSLHKQIH